MELRVLGYVVAVAETGTLVAAAERLHLTQPTLSRQLRDLERRLGTPLFRREGRRMTPTAAGEALLARARVMLAEARAAQEDVRLAAQGLRGRLTITFAGSGINGPLGAALRTVRETLPDVELCLVESFDDARMSAEVLEGRCDLAVQRLPAQDERLAVREWWREPLTLFLPAAHPLAEGDGELPLTALGDVPLVLWPREASPLSYDEIAALCRQAGVVPRIAAEARTVQTLLALAAAGFGAAVLADSYRVLHRTGVTPRPLAGATTSNFLVWRRNTANPLVTRFRELIRQAGPAVPP
ncbi:LysR family transcriptional regulator [Streptomyces sp. NPDC021096]|uniref:LysR substrate-binding domain-containing protein n=1 Tax=Streptomyces sp. NPDC021096 TaxID=3154792 RepID=UPI0033DF0E20